MLSGSTQKPKLNVVGVKIPKQRYNTLADMNEHIQQLLNYLKKIITEIATQKDKTNDDISLIVLQEYAFTPYPIHSKYKSLLVRELHKFINNLPCQHNIILLPGSYHHYKKRNKNEAKNKDKDKKNKNRIAVANEYYEKMKIYQKFDTEKVHVDKTLKEDIFYSLLNAGYILTNNSKFN